MRRVKFWAIGVISFFSIIAGTILHRVLAVSLCTVLGFNSTACFLGDSSRVNAAVPLVMGDRSAIVAQNVDIFRNDGGSSQQPQTDIFNNPNPQSSPQPGVDVFPPPNPSNTRFENRNSNFSSRPSFIIVERGRQYQIKGISADGTKNYTANFTVINGKTVLSSAVVTIKKNNGSPEDIYNLQFEPDGIGMTVINSRGQTLRLRKIRPDRWMSQFTDADGTSRTWEFPTNQRTSAIKSKFVSRTIAFNTKNIYSAANSYLIAKKPCSPTDQILNDLLNGIDSAGEEIFKLFNFFAKKVAGKLPEGFGGLNEEEVEQVQDTADKTENVFKSLTDEVRDKLNLEECEEQEDEQEDDIAKNPPPPQPSPPKEQQDKVKFPYPQMTGKPPNPGMQSFTWTPDNKLVTGNFKPELLAQSLESEFETYAKNLRQKESQNFLQNTIAQFRIPGIPNIPGIPGGGTGIIKDAVLTQVVGQLGGFIENERAFSTSFKDVYSTVSAPPGGEFRPSPANLQVFSQALREANGSPEILLPPGDYEIPGQVFCFKPKSYGPQTGVGYPLAPIKGKQAAPLIALNSRYIAAGIPHQAAQVLSWNIQLGVKYEDMPPTSRAIVDKILPEFKQQLSRSFWEDLQAKWGQISSSIPGVPSFDSVIGRLPGEAGQILNTYQQARASLQQYRDNFDQLQNEMVFTGNAPSDSSDSKYPRGIWSKINDRLYARLLPTTFNGPAAMQVRVLDANGNRHLQKLPKPL